MPRSLGPIQLRLGTMMRWMPVFWLVAVGALFIRLYLASLWLRFGIAKIEADWLTLNPVRGLLTVVAEGQTPMPIPSLSMVAHWLLAARADVLLSVVLPLGEIALAAAFLTGWYVRQAAVVGIGVNASLILGGLASVWFDGRIIALQVLLIIAGRRAGIIGVPGIRELVRWLRRGAESLVEGGTGPAPRGTAA